MGIPFLTEEEKLDLFGPAFKDSPDHPGVVAAVQSEFLWQSKVGLVPDKVHFEDFNYQFVVMSPSESPAGTIHARLYVVFQHIATKHFQDFDCEYIMRFGAYPVVPDLVHLSEGSKEEE